MMTSIDSATALNQAARFWYLVTALGMWLFVYYIVAFYYGPTLQGDFEAGNANQMLTRGHVPGDAVGNLMIAGHILLSAVLTLGGTIQLVPQLRRRALALHRWNGSLFMVAALLVALAGLGLNVLRGDDKVDGSWPSAIDFNGVLILGLRSRPGFSRAADRSLRTGAGPCELSWWSAAAGSCASERRSGYW